MKTKINYGKIGDNPTAKTPLTVVEFKTMPTGHIFLRGCYVYNRESIRVVALKSRTQGINDWAMYYLPIGFNFKKTIIAKILTVHFEPSDDIDKYISDMGYKMVEREFLKSTVKAESAVFDLYRY